MDKTRKADGRFVAGVVMALFDCVEMAVRHCPPHVVDKIVHRLLKAGVALDLKVTPRPTPRRSRKVRR